MPRKMFARLAEECGSSLFEHAIVFMLFMTLLMGIGDFGHALYAYHFVSHAAKSAARWAAVNGSTCTRDDSCAAPATEADIKSNVSSLVPSGIDSGKVTTTVPCGVSDKGVCLGSDGKTPMNPATCTGTPSNAPGCAVQVQVSYDFSFILPLVPGGPLKLSSTSQMVIAH